MPKRIELLPKAEIGRGYAIVDDGKVEIHVSGIMGALKAWLVGGESRPIGNIVGGRLIREIDTAQHSGILITQSGKHMFYGSWEEEAAEPREKSSEPKDASVEEQKQEEAAEDQQSEAEYGALPDMGWEKITGRAYPSTDEKVRFALSTRAFFEAFKKHGYYLFGKDGERFALAIKRLEDASPFPNVDGATEAGEYTYVVL